MENNGAAQSSCGSTYRPKRSSQVAQYVQSVKKNTLVHWFPARSAAQVVLLLLQGVTWKKYGGLMWIKWKN